MRIAILIPVIVLITFTSCKKENNATNTNPATAKVKTYTEDYTTGSTHVSYTFNLNYDNQGRLVSMISAASQGDRFEYSYSSSTVTMDLYNANALSIRELVFLNINSLPDSSIQYNDTQDTSSEKYIYNSSKQLIKFIEYDYSNGVSTIVNTSNFSYDVNGDMTKKTEDYSVTNYDYYTDLINTLALNFDFSPTLGKNLVKTTTYSDGYVTQLLDHSYTFDSYNRLSTEKIIANSGEEIVRTYTY